MRWLVTGGSGMLARDLRTELAERDATFLGRAELDVTDLESVISAVMDHDVVVNAAAYTRVDDAETDVAAATAVNATGAENLAIAAESLGAKLVQISTDYVFDGTATTPYAENAPVNPVSVYGSTKADGERLALAAHPTGTLVLRTAWLYGAGGDNFVAGMLRLADKLETVPVLTDQLGQPTWTVDLARQIVAAVDADVAPGIYHATNSGSTSRFDFAREIYRLAGLDPERVVPAAGDQFKRPAPRPAYSVLGHDAWARTGVAPLRGWREALADAHAHGVFAAR
ncbi:MAG TPA: dTDP-4-dehydrorhamnose reductase [Galbitalea sp.]